MFFIKRGKIKKILKPLTAKTVKEETSYSHSKEALFLLLRFQIVKTVIILRK